MQQAKKKLTSLPDDSFLEQLRNSSSGKVNTRKNWDQFWGSESASSFENLAPSEKIERKESFKKPAYEARREFILFSVREQQIAKEIEAIRVELITLVKTVKEVDFTITKAVMEIPVKPGVYHVRFLERIRRLLKLIREKLENSQTWLKQFMSKKKQRMYWSLYKKKGTSFGLSGERVVSTQTG